MDYDSLFSADTASFMRSPVREIFKRVDLSKIYSFAGGYPSPDAFDLEGVKQSALQVIDRYGSKALQYNATQGIPELRQALSERYGVPLERVQVTTSSQQGIDVCTRVMVDPGDVVLTSNPSYLGALQSFRSYRAHIVGVPHSNDDDEFRARYEQAIDQCKRQGRKVKFLYMIPDFQNPSGETLPLSQRRLLVELARKHGFVIVEDSPYRELRYRGQDVPTIYSLDPDCVLHLGSFSKILAPGLRLGWILGNPQLLDQIYVCKQSLDLCAPVLDQYIATQFVTSGRLDANIEKIKGLYSRRCQGMQELLARYMPQGVTWTRPDGGLFLFLTMPQGFDAVKFYDRALDNGVAYVAGSFFHPDGSGLNTMRLNFSFMNLERIDKGLQLLARLIGEELDALGLRCDAGQ